jgi:hypothetical protein
VLVEPVAAGQPGQLGDVDHLAVPAGRLDQLLHPVVVAAAVVDHQLGAGHRGRAGRSALVAVRVGGRIVDQRRHPDPITADRGHDAAVDVGGGDDGHAPIDRVLVRRR